MNESIPGFEILRAQRWDETGHKNRLEEELMSAHRNKTGLFVLTRSRAALVAFALVLFGGFAGAGTATMIRHWHGQKVMETPLDDGRTRIRIEEDGETVLDTVLEPDTYLFQETDKDGKPLKRPMKVKPVREDEK